MKRIIIVAILFCIAGQLKLKAQGMAGERMSLPYIYANLNPVSLEPSNTQVKAKAYSGSYLASPTLPKAFTPMSSTNSADAYSLTASIQSVKGQAFSNPDEKSGTKKSIVNAPKVPRNVNLFAGKGTKHGLGLLARVFSKKESACPHF